MVKIQNAKIQDAPEIAGLIMEAMNEECCKYFYGPNHNKNDFHKFLTALVVRKDSQYSYVNTLVARDAKGMVTGIAVSYDGANLTYLRKAFIEGVIDIFGRDFSHITDETSEGELYLDSFAVLRDFRRLGIGTSLLEATQQKAFNLHIPYVGLLVDDENIHALQYYLRFGFKIKGVNSWGGHAMKHLQIPSQDFTE